jgi:protein-disulfide isomerase/uncharacterized membrane protein
MSVLMIGFSIYLTSHYFEVKFPTGLSTGGLCNFNSFFNCDVTINSPASNIAGIPISIFGIIIGALPLLGYFFKTEEYEGTIHSLLLVNAIGCVVLFVYSLVALGGLCPFCTLYYVASIISALCFYKTSDMKTPSIIPVVAIVVLFSASSFAAYNTTKGKTDKINQYSDSLINQYKGLKNLGAPSFESPFRMASATEVFTDAPIQITKFSDFECPACKMLSEVLHKVKEKYKGKVNIQYMFYPLDNACNPAMERALHRFACKAAYLATCLPNKFKEVEHDIFANQSSLSDDWINEYVKKENVLDCYNAQAAKDTVTKHMAEAKKFGVKSTPTFILNGVKIEGVLPAAQLYILIDYLLQK